jgi:phage terminase small subunit
VSRKPPTTQANRLSSEAEAWVSSVEDRYELQDHHRKLLNGAATMWDRTIEARAAIAKHGTTYVDRFGAPRPRPEVAIERDSLTTFRQLVAQLGLDEGDAVPNGRPAHPNSKRAVFYAGN